MPYNSKINQDFFKILKKIQNFNNSSKIVLSNVLRFIISEIWRKKIYCQAHISLHGHDCKSDYN